MGITVPAHPCYMLWPSSDKFISQLRKISLNPMLFTLSIWKNCSGKYKLSSPCSPLTNITFNPEIPDSLSYDAMLPWTKAGIFQLRHLVNPVTRKLLTFNDLQSKYKIPKNLFYSFLQIQHFLSTKIPQLTLTIPTEFEMVCSRGPHDSHLISNIYKILHAASPVTEQTHTYMRKWSHILNRPIQLSEWKNIWESTSKTSRCVAQKETTYKILMFWYRTPEFLLRQTDYIRTMLEMWLVSGHSFPYILGMSLDNAILVTDPCPIGKNPRIPYTPPTYTSLARLTPP